MKPTKTPKKKGLYKPLRFFKWKDATDKEVEKDSINAYKKYRDCL